MSVSLVRIDPYLSISQSTSLPGSVDSLPEPPSRSESDTTNLATRNIQAFSPEISMTSSLERTDSYISQTSLPEPPSRSEADITTIAIRNIQNSQITITSNEVDEEYEDCPLRNNLRHLHQTGELKWACLPFCICTPGIAVLGYLGYHAVRWIINKCHKTEKIDQVAQKTIGSVSQHRVSPSSSHNTNAQILSPPQITASRQSKEVQVDEIALRQKSESQKDVAVTKIQSAYRGHIARLTVRKLRNEKREEQREAAAIKIQSICRRHSAKTQLKALRKEKLEQQEVAATKIQSICRGYKARLMLKQLQSIRSKSVTIIDAKDSGMKWYDVLVAIKTIARKELKDDEGWVSASDYVKEEYFSGASIAPGLSFPETILIAKSDKEIVGFIITAKREEDEESLWSLPPDTGYVAYLAVDSQLKKSGVGTKLMLAAMNKTKQLGKRYLTLEYIAKGLGVDENRGKAKIGFYNSFSTKFGIPMKEKGNVYVSKQLHVHPYYDLQEVDFSSIKQIA